MRAASRPSSAPQFLAGSEGTVAQTSKNHIPDLASVGCLRAPDRYWLSFHSSLAPRLDIGNQKSSPNLRNSQNATPRNTVNFVDEFAPKEVLLEALEVDTFCARPGERRRSALARRAPGALPPSSQTAGARGSAQILHSRTVLEATPTGLMA